MARSKAQDEMIDFSGGLNTEAPPLNFPKNAATVIENFIINRDSTIQRRFGMDYEDSYQLSTNRLTSDFNDLSIITHEWRNAGDSGTKSFLVQQIGFTVTFYDNSKSDLSTNESSFTINLSSYKTTTANVAGAAPINVSYGKGVLFIVSRDTDPIAVVYNETGDTITVTQLDLKIRDQLGVDDTLDVDEHPSSLSTTHEYNLLNQGWVSADITTYNTNQSEYPANSQIWTLGKDKTTDLFSDAQLVKEVFGNTRAPRGKFILDIFDRDRDTVSGLTGVTTEIDKGRPTAVGFMSGRAFYAGIVSDRNSGPTLNGYILFSRVLESSNEILTDAVQCYQEADPTSEHINSLVSTDGGYLVIQDSGEIRKLLPVGRVLLVFAERGVWAITGNDGNTFSATSQNIDKITDSGSVNANSVIEVEDSVLYWANEGIFRIGREGDSLSFRSQNISREKIQTFYNSLDAVAKLYSTGTYDRVNQKVMWLYNDDSTYDGVTEKYKYTQELVIDLTLGSFYKHIIGELAVTSPFITGYARLAGLSTNTVTTNVQVAAVNLTVNGDDIIITSTVPGRTSAGVKYSTAVPIDVTNTKFTFSEYADTSFLDWFTNDSTGVDAPSQMVTGINVYGDSSKQKQATYMTVNCRRTEDGFEDNGGVGLDLKNQSSCLIQARWDFSDNTLSGKWSPQFEAYRLLRIYIPLNVNDPFDYGHDIIITRNKIRGRGKSLAFLISSSAGKDLQLLGYSLSLTGNTEE